MAGAGTILNLDIDAGTDYYLDTYYADYTTNLPKDTTGYTAIMEIKSGAEAKYPYLTLSSDDGRILLGGVDGTILIRFAPEDTNPNLQPTRWNRAVYDLVLTDVNGYRTKLLKGFINVIGTCSLDYSPLIIREYISPISITSSAGVLYPVVI